MLLIAGASACGRTHKKNDDRILANSVVLLGAELPETSALTCETAQPVTQEISPNISWQSSAATTSFDNTIACIAFDGIGGSARGNEAAQSGAKYFAKHKDSGKSLVTLLSETAAFVTERQKDFPQYERGYTVAAGFTINSIKVKKSPIPTNMTASTEKVAEKPFTICTVFNAGDSRTYRYSNKQLDVLTIDHTLANYKRSMGIEAPANEENVVTRYLGGDNITPFDIYEAFKLKDLDVMFSCSDGFWGYLSEEIIAERLSELVLALQGILTPLGLISTDKEKTVQLPPMDRYEKTVELKSAVPTNRAKEVVAAPEQSFTINQKLAQQYVQGTIRNLIATAQLNGSPDDISVVMAVNVPADLEEN